MLGCEELVHPALPPHPPTYLGASSLTQPFSYDDYNDMKATLWSIQEKQVLLQAYIQSEHAALHNFVQKRHDKLHGMIASQTQYF